MAKRYKYQDYEVIWSRSKATGSDRLLLLALAKFRQPLRGMSVTKETLAATMNCSLDTVDRCLKRLKDLGELTWDTGSSGSRRANRYYILLDGLDFVTADCTLDPPQIAENTPRRLPPLNSNETVVKDIDIKFDFSNGSDCFRLSLDLRPDMSVLQILDAKDRFVSHKSFLLAEDSQVMSRWQAWLLNEKS
jgi:hypothetical protein